MTKQKKQGKQHKSKGSLYYESRILSKKSSWLRQKLMRLLIQQDSRRHPASLVFWYQLTISPHSMTGDWLTSAILRLQQVSEQANGNSGGAVADHGGSSVGGGSGGGRGSSGSSAAGSRSSGGRGSSARGGGGGRVVAGVKGTAVVLDVGDTSLLASGVVRVGSDALGVSLVADESRHGLSVVLKARSAAVRAQARVVQSVRVASLSLGVAVAKGGAGVILSLAPCGASGQADAGDVDGVVGGGGLSQTDGREGGKDDRVAHLGDVR